MLSNEQRYVILLVPPELLSLQAPEAIVASYMSFYEAETEIKKLTKDTPRGTRLFLWDRMGSGYVMYVWERNVSYPTKLVYECLDNREYFD